VCACVYVGTEQVSFAAPHRLASTVRIKKIFGVKLPITPYSREGHTTFVLDLPRGGAGSRSSVVLL
ncbi:hypothetical protein KUCAC02_036689, partial [Chaenocephalus aceratus]